MRPALFSFTDLYIKTANYYFEESKNDWLNFIHLMPHIFIGRSKWNYFGEQTITYQNIPNYIYHLADFGVTGFDSALLCNALFRILCENFFHSVNLSSMSAFCLQNWLKLLLWSSINFLKQYIIYVAPVSIWVVKLIEIIAVSLLW